jgi:hypothetical protein
MNPEFWQTILENDFQISNDTNLETLLPELLEMLASPDPVLRDEFAYSILAVWLERNLFSASQMRQTLFLLEGRLEVGLGKVGSDLVFTRSFAPLIFAGIQHCDNAQPFLQESEVLHCLELALRYLALEQDLRGFVPPNGWAHAVAHTADWLDELALSPHCTAPQLERIVSAICHKIPAPHVWLFDEEDRLSYAVARAIGRGLLSPVFLESCFEVLMRWISQDDERKSNQIQRHNAKGFLRSLYFQILSLQPSSSLLGVIFRALEGVG